MLNHHSRADRVAIVNVTSARNRPTLKVYGGFPASQLCPPRHTFERFPAPGATRKIVYSYQGLGAYAGPDGVDRTAQLKAMTTTQGDPQETAGVREGAILAGKYRVEKVLGVGGMGVVVAAQHVQLDEKVAIKFLLPTMLRNADVVGRFSREARAAVKIKSEHVARVSDVGTLENGAPFMVMEFLEGEDLAAWIERQGPMPVEQAVDFVLQSCVGVASAHAIGIVHRDLKPANLFCLRGNDGQLVIKVLDFGISKVTNPSPSDSGGSMTHTSAVMGSPYYMSPEQMQSAKEVDTRTDIWALGVVLYELLTRTTPFAGESFADIAIKVATAPFAPVHGFRSDVPSGLESVILKCLEKDKRRRYGNVADLAVALTDFGSKRARHWVERIVGILHASGLSTRSPAVGAPVPPKLSASDGLAGRSGPNPAGSWGTMAPSATTHSGSAGTVRGRSAQVLIAATVAVLAIAVGVGWKLRAKPATFSSTQAQATSASSTQATASSAASENVAPVQPAKIAELPPDTRAVSNGETPSANAQRANPVAAGSVVHSPVRPPAQSTLQPQAHPAPGLPTSTSNCRVVSFFDADGNQHFKQQCGK
jgi:serine/threonine protein kinase